MRLVTQTPFHHTCMLFPYLPAAEHSNRCHLDGPVLHALNYSHARNHSHHRLNVLILAESIDCLRTFAIDTEQYFPRTACVRVCVHPCRSSYRAAMGSARARACVCSTCGANFDTRAASPQTTRGVGGDTDRAPAAARVMGRFVGVGRFATHSRSPKAVTATCEPLPPWASANQLLSIFK